MRFTIAIQTMIFPQVCAFTPFEAVVTALAECATILLLGPPAIAVLSYKLIKVSMASFVHGNLKLPCRVDSQLRKVLVTPDLHRIHHSALPEETNSNYGGITPWWDRLFRTYIDQPLMGHENLEMGLRGRQSIESVKLHRMLLQPFEKNQVWNISEQHCSLTEVI